MIIALGLYFCGREYKDIMDAMTIRFGEDALLVAGLLNPKAPDIEKNVRKYFRSFGTDKTRFKCGFVLVEEMP